MMTLLPWALCGLLAMLLIAVYSRGIRQQVHVAALTVEMIMSDEERAAQRGHLYEFVRRSHYRDAASLGAAVTDGIVKIATVRAHITMPANRDILWTMTQSPDLAALVDPSGKYPN